MLLVLSVILTLHVSPHPTFAQGTGRIDGVVADPLLAAVPNATVVLWHEDRLIASATSGADGAFVFDTADEGVHRIEANAPGFQTRVVSVAVRSGETVRVEMILPLGPLETAVSVTAAATTVLPSQVGAAVTVIDSATIKALGALDVIDVLRLTPGTSLVQTGGRGGQTSQFIRGGNPNFNRVLLDGIPVNDIGGGVDLAPFALAGIEQVEVLRQANSVVSGPDALAGVVAATTTRGRTRRPQVVLGLDGGTLATHRESVSVGGLAGRSDYFSEFANVGTDNDVPNNDYRVSTYAGRAGSPLGSHSYMSGTLRWLDRATGSPNSIGLYGTPDDARQSGRMYLAGFGVQTQAASRWTASVRVGLSDQRTEYVNPSLSGSDIFGIGFGDRVTITGANGYAATGRGVLDWGPFESSGRATRRGLYAQTTYEVSRALSLSGGGNIEREAAYTDPDAAPTTRRTNGTAWAEGRGTVAGRVTVLAGLGYARLDGHASRLTPRLSAALMLRRPAAAAPFGDVRLTVNAGKGVKASSAAAVDRSLYRLLLGAADGEALAGRHAIGPIAPERGRNLDVGVEQGLFGGAARVRVTWFDNEFFDLVEFVGRNQLPAFGVPSAVAAVVGGGAYVNSQSYTARGVELSADARVANVRVSGSYTYLDAAVTRSLSGNVVPQYNPLFPDVPIGGYTALVGARPFRRPANTGTLLAVYTRGRVTGALSGYFAGTSDDSTFLVGADEQFGNSLLLPNRDLNFGYSKVDVSGGVQVTPRVRWFATVENVFDAGYQPAFGFPALPVNLRTGVAVTLGGL